jgi:hypothetical protein
MIRPCSSLHSPMSSCYSSYTVLDATCLGWLQGFSLNGSFFLEGFSPNFPRIGFFLSFRPQMKYHCLRYAFLKYYFCILFSILRSGIIFLHYLLPWLSFVSPVSVSFKNTQTLTGLFTTGLHALRTVIDIQWHLVNNLFSE